MGAASPGHAELLLAEHGLQLGHFPQSFPYATIGGFAATRSSGQNSAGYGRFDAMIRELTVVTPKGIIRPGQASPATAAGPSLKALFIGSEGALGIITRVRVRVHPIPETKLYEAFSFPSFIDGANALREVTQTDAGPTVLRLSDEIESSVNLTSTDNIGEQDESEHKGCLAITLFEGTTQHAQSRHEETRAIMIRNGGQSLGEGPARTWEEGRFGAPVLRDSLIDGGALCETLETATDWSNVPRLKKAVGKALTTSLVEDGSRRSSCAISATSTRRAAPCTSRWWARPGRTAAALAEGQERGDGGHGYHGGTVTHHHAVGTDHLPWMGLEVGQVGIAALQAVKRELDPAGVLNPGKTFDLSDAEASPDATRRI